MGHLPDMRPQARLPSRRLHRPALQSDVVSLHCPLLPSTFHIIDAKR